MVLVYGVGINDADYVVQPTVGGKRKVCPYYRKWKSMLERCYHKEYLDRFPQYEGCIVCEEWLTFSNFKSWMQYHVWEGKHLDKDLLGSGKIYNPDSCAFILPLTNMFLTSRLLSKSTGNFLQPSGRYIAYCNNPFTKSRVNLGTYDTQESAFRAWKEQKHKYSLQLSEIEYDNRVKEKLKIYFKEG